MSTRAQILEEIGRRSAVLARSTGRDSLATNSADESLLMMFVCDGALKVLLVAGRANIQDHLVVGHAHVNLGGGMIYGTLTISAQVEADALEGFYVTLGDQSIKISGNTVSDDDGNTVLTLLSDWQIDPQLALMCSICIVPEYANSDAQVMDLLTMVPRELNLAIVYWTLCEWLSANGEEQQSRVMRNKYEVELIERRLTREKKTATRVYRPF